MHTSKLLMLLLFWRMARWLFSDILKCWRWHSDGWRPRGHKATVCCLPFFILCECSRRAESERLTSQSRMDLIDYLHIALRQRQTGCLKVCLHIAWASKHSLFCSDFSECSCSIIGKQSTCVGSLQKADWLCVFVSLFPLMGQSNYATVAATFAVMCKFRFSKEALLA